MRYLILILISITCSVLRGQSPADMAFPVTTTLVPDSGKVRFTWVNTVGTTMQVFRKSALGGNLLTPYAQFQASNQLFVDTITPGRRYEYCFRMTRSTAPTTATTYLSVANAANAIHYKGKAMIIVDSTFVTDLQPDVDRLKLDLICEGWMVNQLAFMPYYPVDTIKQRIKEWYLQDTLSHHAVLLLGHVSIPYSGDIYPDGHTNHRGAWPADVYYGDVTRVWTDNTVNVGSATRIQNRNYIGDGKFDVSYLANKPKVAVGRVDLNDMPLYSLSHLNLLRQYLAKDHNYRTKAFTVRNKVLLDDNFGYFSGEAFAQNAYRVSYALCGKDSVVPADFIWDANSYLFSYGCGAGTWQSASGIGATSNMIWVDSIRTVFTMLFGSYFGDFDNQNNLLRAPLATPGYTLTSCWVGRGHWYFHTMALGLPISHTVINNQYNNEYSPGGYSTSGVHTALHGDPTLTLNPIYQPAALVLAQDTTQAGQVLNLQWQASADSVLGYYVYRAAALTDSFNLITPQYVNALSFTDTAANVGNNVYMVRPVKLQQTITGTYYNVGIGIVDSLIVEQIIIQDPTDTTDTTTIGIIEDVANKILVYPNPSTGVFMLKPLQTKPLQVELYNAVGALLWKQQTVSAQTQINISQHSNGVYYLKITDVHSRQVGYKKLVKY